MNHAERRKLWEAIYADLQKTFQREAAKRPSINDTHTIADPITGLHEPMWVLTERQAMLVATNHHRATQGLPALTETDIERVERMAVGHTDYASKFALYCTELALGDKDIRP